MSSRWCRRTWCSRSPPPAGRGCAPSRSGPGARASPRGRSTPLKSPVGDLGLRGVGLLHAVDAELAAHPVGALELDVAVANDLEAVAPRVAEVEALPAPAAEQLQALALDRGPRGVDVVDDEPEVALLVGRLASPFGDGDELVAHVDERHAAHPPAQLEGEQAAVEVERGVEVTDLERHVVDADQPRGAVHAPRPYRKEPRGPGRTRTGGPRHRQSRAARRAPRVRDGAPLPARAAARALRRRGRPGGGSRRGGRGPPPGAAGT